MQTGRLEESRPMATAPLAHDAGLSPIVYQPTPEAVFEICLRFMQQEDWRPLGLSRRLSRQCRITLGNDGAVAPDIGLAPSGGQRDAPWVQSVGRRM